MSFLPHALVCRYRPAAWLRVTGSDAAEFLQGQFTNDLAGAQAGSAVYGLWLDQKGKVQADSFIGRGAAPGEYWIASLDSPGAVLRERLEHYIIADDVVVEDLSAEQAGVALLGEGTGAWLAAEPRPGRCFRGRRTREENWEWIYPLAAEAEVAAALAGASAVAAGELERRRIAAGFPAVPADIGPRELPNEGGLEADAISYTKGCYLGQEVMARLRTRGRLRRKLWQVQGPGPLPSVPAALWLDGRQQGELRSAAPTADGRGFVGLALLAVDPPPAGRALALVPDGPPLVAVTSPSA